MGNKTWEELTISDDFMFKKVMQNAALCKELLETILNIKIREIHYPEEEKSIDIQPDAKSIRLDVYVESEDQVFNVEMQTSHADDLPKRSRYYTGMIDLGLIEKGAYYKDLNPSYVIFICTFDPFGKGRHIYTFENRCKEEPELSLGDENRKVFLNALGSQDDVSKELKHFLEYVAGVTPKEGFAKKLEEEVQRIKESREWRKEYMLMEIRDRENYEKGKEAGRELGIRQGKELGIQQGRELGIRQEQQKIIAMMQKHGCSVSDISRMLELSEEEVRRVLNH